MPVLSSVGTIGSNQSKTAGTTLVITPTNQLNAGDVGILVIAADNFNTTDGDNSELTTVIDSKGNTWDKVREFTNGNGTAATGATVAIFKSDVTVNVLVTDTITINFANTITARAATIWAFHSNA